MSTIVHSTGTIAAPASGPVIPMPGRLPVSYYDLTLHKGPDPALDEVPDGSVVYAIGTITAVTQFDGGRIMMAIADEDGHSAYVLLTPGVFRAVRMALYSGVRVIVRGSVFRTGSGPAMIHGHGVHVRAV
jgi:hypothetical protein